MKEKGFFAYGSELASSGECIEEAIVKINASGEVELGSWKKLKVSGRLIISSILETIDDSDFFCADLTSLNNNVLFELGYAIAKKMPLFLINDVSQLDSIRKYKSFGLLETTGYSAYSNTDDIVQKFLKSTLTTPQVVVCGIP